MKSGLAQTFPSVTASLSLCHVHTDTALGKA